MAIIGGIDMTYMKGTSLMHNAWNSMAFVIVRDMAGEESLGMCVFLVMILVFHVDDLVWGQSCHRLVSFCFGCSAAHPLQHTYDRAPRLHGVCSS